MKKTILLNETIIDAKIADRNGFSKKEFTFIFVIFLAMFKALSVSLLGIGLPNYILYDLNSTSSLAGYSNAIYCLPYAFFPFILSKWTDKIGRKRGLIISVSSASLIYTFFLTDFSLVTAFILRFLDGISTSLFWPILQATMSDIQEIEPEISDKRVNQYNIGWNSGVIVGLLLGALAVFLLRDNKVIFIIATISTFCMIPTVYFLKIPSGTSLNDVKINNRNKNVSNCINSNINIESSSEKLTELHNNKIEIIKDTNKKSMALHTIPLSIPIIAILIHSITLGSLGILLPSKLEFYLYPSFLIYILSMFRVSSIIAISKKVSNITSVNIRKYILFAGFGLFMVMLLFSLFMNLYLYILLLIAVGILTITIYTIPLKIFLDKNSVECTAKYTGLFEAVIGFGFGIGPIITGLIADHSIDLAFGGLSIFNLILTVIIYVLFNKFLKKKM